MHQVLALLHSARTLAPEIIIAGIILNHPRPRDERRDPSLRSNRAELVRLLQRNGWAIPVLELEHGVENLTILD